MQIQPNIEVATPVSVSCIIAPTYPEFLYGSKRYTVNLLYTWNAEGETVETLASRTFDSRDTAIMYANSIIARVGCGSVSIVD